MAGPPRGSSASGRSTSSAVVRKSGGGSVARPGARATGLLQVHPGQEERHEGGDGQPRRPVERGAVASPGPRRGGGLRRRDRGPSPDDQGGQAWPVPRLVADLLEERADEPDGSPQGGTSPGSPSRGRRGRTDRPPGRRPRLRPGGGRCRRRPGGTVGRAAPRPGRGGPGSAPGVPRGRGTRRGRGEWPPSRRARPGTRRGRPASAKARRPRPAGPQGQEQDPVPSPAGRGCPKGG